ncbi:flagellar hook-associated protein FlgL [Massilia yuzhufengensis]|uniref:Flagellar hook-associated protein 3 FlgL n=1 Tax=Massilia yuzhufengensis TaxID=1164594 RepID=A0A1I1G1H6_9BURK|nr:flagellar hook-associated protein FlgL [Massilia yuzhufengensis]SFC05132.1 flagellar hook-associated protein 3 FlgL [Massilia yuzhufengensis]
MRIATTQYQSTMNQSLQANQERITTLTQQMASNKRILVPSDDPVDSVRLARLSREESTVQQYRDNIASIKIRLTKTEGYLSNMSKEMVNGRDLLVWASDGSNAPDDLKAMVSPLESLRESVFYNANSIDQEGHYIFSGTLTKTAPIKYDATAPVGSRYTYVGNTNSQNVVVGNGITQAANQNLQGLEKLLNHLDLSIDTLKSPTVSANDPAVRMVLGNGLKGFDDALDLVTGKIANLGGSQNIMATLDANHANVSLSNRMAITDIGALDVGEAATALNGYSTALQATYKAYSRIGTMSLFSVL